MTVEKIESAQMTPAMVAFLAELVTLCGKHGAMLLDCGCCGGLQVSIGGEQVDNVTPISEKGFNDED